MQGSALPITELNPYVGTSAESPSSKSSLPSILRSSRANSSFEKIEGKRTHPVPPDTRDYSSGISSLARTYERTQNIVDELMTNGVSKQTLRTEETETMRGKSFGIDTPSWENDVDDSSERDSPDDLKFTQSVQNSSIMNQNKINNHMNRGGEPSDAIATMHEKIPPIRKKIDRNSNIWSRHTQSTLLRGKELQKTRERIQVANEEENERSLSTSTTRRTYGVHVTDKKSKKKRERLRSRPVQKINGLPTVMMRQTQSTIFRDKELQRNREHVQATTRRTYGVPVTDKESKKKRELLRSRPVQKINGLPTVMMRQTQSTIFRDKELQRNREHVQATTRRTYGLPVTDKVSKKKRERLRLRPVQKINGLPTVMMRQTQSTIFRDKELQRNREHVQATKEKASQLRTSFPQRMCRHAMPEKKMKERRKKVQLPVHEEKDVGWQNTTSFDCENGFDRNRPKATRKKQNSNVGQPTKVATKSSAPKSMDFNRKNGSKWEVDIGKQTSTQNGLWRKPNEKAVKDIYEHEVGMCANSVPKYVSDDDIMSVSDISQSAKKELSRHSTIAAQIESCSWQDLYHNLNLLGHTPEEILEALHIGTWKPPPALSIKLLDLISPSELEILLRVDEDGNTPLHLCCGNLSPPPTGHEEMQTDVDCSVLTALLERTPESLGKQNVEGDTPLHLFLTSPLVSACVDKQSYDFQKDAIAAFRIIEKRMPTRDCFLIQDSLGASPLHNAIANNVGEPILLSLIEAEPKACKVEDKAGLVPLHYVAAFLETSPLVVKKMIEEYTYSVCHKSLDGDTPLHILIRNSSDDNQSNRELILDDNSRLVLNLLLGNLSSSSNRNGSDKDFNGQYCPLLIENREKLTPLHCFALFNASVEVGKILMSHPEASKALIMTNAHGSTPLHIAVAHPTISIEITQVLGTMASTMTQDRLRRTPLHVASQNINISMDVIRCLIDINPLACHTQSNGGYLPIHLAVHSNAKLGIVRKICKSFPDCTKRGSMLGDTPLHKAATNNVPIEVLDFLIGHDNSQLFKENQLGDLPLHCATAGSASIDVIRSLVIAWPQGVSKQNRAGNTPLHFLLQNNPSHGKLNLLIDSSLNSRSCILLVNKNGDSPLQVAKNNDVSPDIILQLQNATEDGTSQQSLDHEWSSFDDLLFSESESVS